MEMKKKTQLSGTLNSDGKMQIKQDTIYIKKTKIAISRFC